MENIYPFSSTRIFYGSVYIALAATALPLYLIIIIIYMRHKMFQKLPCYWIMSAMGIFDLLYLSSEVALGVRLLTNEEYCYWIEEVFMCLMYSTYSGSVIMICLLATNRLFVLVLPVLPSIFYKVCILIICAYVAAIFGICVSNKMKIYYEPLFLTPGAESDREWAAYVLSVDSFVGFISFGSTLVMYVVITVYLVVKRFQSNQQNFVKDLKVLWQGVLIFLVGLFILLNRNFATRFIDVTYWYTASLNVFCIFYCGLFNPMLYLGTNRELRRVVRSVLFLKKSSTSTVEVIRIKDVESEL
ncbi:hypothetical protein QR680_003895 [Steinernema hermaphroditum]|uniref:G-protein coupled receptors family 1 profile domain-containing protein n=1 Tax=Steinernema hermaphroditum TaxID=289476 RepID=A0AA39HP94_9BILA|nr:hypothetical protein QR680_003895 [Steinernema hermaphroditum]